MTPKAVNEEPAAKAPSDVKQPSPQRPELVESPPSGSAPSSSKGKRSSFIDRAFSKKNQDTAKHFFSAYAQTWVGLSPIWLMGEALTPGTKVGTQFRKGTTNLVKVAEEIRTSVSISSQDIVVIVDEKLRTGKVDTVKTAEVLKAAGDNVILVVSSSLDRAQEQLKQLNAEFGPKIRKSVLSNSRDVIVILDKALKNPIVITGVSKFAKSQGIPHADALLRLASLGLAKIVNALPEENLEGAEAMVEELDAAELERTSSSEDVEIATKIGHQGDEGAPSPKATKHKPDGKVKKDTCIVA
ncbi:hypothetical protein BU17DRAFT_81565 [Hysterangium stoloniferum]|nr:hypothetical protein BU17DRAFT_81565 [Hysterangium stoloniferum]